MKYSLIISNKSDFHARAVRSKFLNSSSFLFLTPQMDKNVVFNLSEHGADVYVDEKKISLSSIKSVWTRKYSSAAFRDIFDKDDDDSQIIEKQFKSKTQVVFLRELAMLIKKNNSSCLFVNHFYDNNKNSFRICQLQDAKKIGFNVPRTIVTSDKRLIYNFLKKNDSITKRLYQKGISFGKISHSFGTLDIGIDDIDMKNGESYYDTPVFVQEKIKKAYELRVIVIGKKIFVCKLDNQLDNLAEQSKLDWRFNVRSIPHSEYQLPKKIQNKCFSLLKMMGLQYGAIDLIKNMNDEYVFLEINPNGQYYWIEEETNMPLSQAMADLLQYPDKNKL